MDSLVGPYQSAFLKGRHTLDGALVAGEMIDSCKRNNIKEVILKLDFHKAFDSISSDSLDCTFDQIRFPS